jgi:SAM-dependent methyltransferase
MKGFVPTPKETVDAMVERLFLGQPPRPDDRVLDPGCGTGEFIDGVIRWCKRQGLPLPRITGVESDPRHLSVLRAKYERLRAVHIEHADFLTDGRTTYNFIVGNPPYVAITALSEREKARYRARYAAARGRFDLYLLFFEQALHSLAPGGRLVFITPEKYLYVETAGPLRALLARYNMEEIRLVREDTFGGLVTYPTITVLRNASRGRTHVVRRDGSKVTIMLPQGQQPWLPFIEGAAPHQAAVTLGDLCLRISCGVATGADSVFVQPTDGLDPALQHFARPTIAGRQLSPATTDLPQRFVMLIPYDMQGQLLPLEELKALGRYLTRDDVRLRLLARTCVKPKPWYAFHETPVLRDILRPKILCKDISERPHFWVDRSGQIVPRHSVYYLVPQEANAIDVIASYLQSPSAHRWLVKTANVRPRDFFGFKVGSCSGCPCPMTWFRRLLAADQLFTQGCHHDKRNWPSWGDRRMRTAFDDVLDEIKARGFHNHRLENHSGSMSRGILRDLRAMCEPFERDFTTGQIREWLDFPSPGGRARKLDLVVAEPAAQTREPDLTRLRLCVENKSVVTAHRNRTNRYDNLSDLVGVLHRNRPDAILVATVLIGLAENVLNVPDRVKPFLSSKEFTERVLPRLSSGDDSLWSEFPQAVSRNRSVDPERTAKKFRELPTRPPGRTDLVAYDYVLLVPVIIDNVHPPRVARDNGLGIDIDTEYRTCLTESAKHTRRDGICRTMNGCHLTN